MSPEGVRREELHGAPLRDWVERNGMPFVKAVAATGPDVRDQFLAFVGVWVFDRGFSAAYDDAEIRLLDS